VNWELDDYELVVIVAKLIKGTLVHLHVLGQIADRALSEVLGLLNRDLLVHVLIHLLDLLMR
jgi:hypothetical protein